MSLYSHMRWTILRGLLVLGLFLFFAGSVYAQCTDQNNPQFCNGDCIPANHLCILEPWPGMPSSIDPQATGGALGPFLYYVNSGVWQWAFKMGVAVAVLNGVFGGFQIVTSNGDSGKSEEGKQRFIWSAIGLIMLLLSSTILAFLNPVGFQSA